MTNTFYEAVQNRRSIYGLSKEALITDERLQEVIELTVQSTPSVFNSQSGRIVVLLGEQSEQFWQYAFDEVKKSLPAEKYEGTKQRFENFAAGYGTVLFYEDYEVIENLQEKFSYLADDFPIWSHQGSGMLQNVIWTALEHEGFGASLQHYYPDFPKQAIDAWGIQPKWKLIAQLPFGKPTAPPKEKEVKPAHERVFIIK